MSAPSGIKLPQLPIDINQMNAAFKKINSLISEMLDEITSIYRKIGLRYYVKPNHETLSRILIPQQFKVFVDFADVYCMLENRGQALKGNCFWKDDKNFKQLSQKQDKVRSLNFVSVKKENLVKYQDFKSSSDSYPRGDETIEIPSYQKKQIRTNGQKFVSPVDRAEKQIIDYVEKRVSSGYTMTRKDFRKVAGQIGQFHYINLGERWFRKFVKKHPDTMQLLTHGNSSSLNQKLSQNRFERIKVPEGNFESYDRNTLSNTLGNTLNDDNLVDSICWDSNEQPFDDNMSEENEKVKRETSQI